MELLSMINNANLFSIDSIAQNKYRIQVNNIQEFNKVITFLNSDNSIYISEVMSNVYRDFGKEYPTIGISIIIEYKDKYKYAVKWSPISSGWNDERKIISYNNVEGIVY